jgi:molecular chaperone GrpE (heat shock protein)
MSDDFFAVAAKDDAIAALRDRLAALERELAEARSGTARIWAVKYENAAAELTALRQRHAEAVEKATVEAVRWARSYANVKPLAEDEMVAAWLASEAKARLT